MRSHNRRLTSASRDDSANTCSTMFHSTMPIYPKNLQSIKVSTRLKRCRRVSLWEISHGGWTLRVEDESNLVLSTELQTWIDQLSEYD